MNPVLSVIIPIYKVEDYLERCVMSVINQEYSPMEVILVDDGSPDRCPWICDELAKRDSRIQVIHKPNGGLSSARNAGIEVAKGEYLAFLDSDDQWNPGMLAPLMEKIVASPAQMTLFQRLGLHPDGRITKRKVDIFTNEFKLYSRDELYPMLIAAGGIFESACIKILRKDFVISNNLTFKPGIISEDVEWMFRILRSIDTIALSNIPLFICTIGRPGSITQTGSTKSVRDTLANIQSSIDFYEKSPHTETRMWELAECSYLWSIAMGLFHKVSPQEAAPLKQHLIALARVLNLYAHPKSRKVGLLYKLLGFSLTCKICELYVKKLRVRLNQVSFRES